MLNLDWIDILNLSILIVSSIYYVITCRNINRVTIYGAKYLGMATLKVLPTTCFRYNSEEISLRFPIPMMKLKKIDMSFTVQVLQQNY